MTKDNMEFDPVFAEIAAEGARADDALGVASVYADLLARAPEHKMAPRLDAMTRAVEILGEPQQGSPGHPHHRHQRQNLNRPHD